MSTANLLQLVPVVLLVLLLIGKEVREIRVSLDNNRIRANVLYRDGHVTRHIVKKTNHGKGGERFTLADKTYRVIPDLVYRTGLWRVPTAYYIAGRMTPIDLLDVKSEKYTAEDYNVATEHHVVEGLLTAFRDSVLTPEMSLILLGLVVLGASGGVYYVLNGRFDELVLLLEATTGGATLPQGGGTTPTLPGN